MIKENALSAKTITEEMIVNKLNLKAGIEEFVSHKSEINPSGIVTLTIHKTFSSQTVVTAESTP